MSSQPARQAEMQNLIFTIRTLPPQIPDFQLQTPRVTIIYHLENHCDLIPFTYHPLRILKHTDEPTSQEVLSQYYSSMTASPKYLNKDIVSFPTRYVAGALLSAPRAPLNSMTPLLIHRKGITVKRPYLGLILPYADSAQQKCPLEFLIYG